MRYALGSWAFTWYAQSSKSISIKTEGMQVTAHLWCLSHKGARPNTLLRTVWEQAALDVLSADYQRSSISVVRVHGRTLCVMKGCFVKSNLRFQVKGFCNKVSVSGLMQRPKNCWLKIELIFWKKKRALFSLDLSVIILNCNCCLSDLVFHYYTKQCYGFNLMFHYSFNLVFHYGFNLVFHYGFVK